MKKLFSYKKEDFRHKFCILGIKFSILDKNKMLKNLYERFGVTEYLAHSAQGGIFSIGRMKINSRRRKKYGICHNNFMKNQDTIQTYKIRRHIMKKCNG